MISKLKNLLLKIDLFGPTPSLMIFKDHNYKSLGGSMISIIGIILIIVYFIISLINYFKFENPAIIYLKANTQKNNITINLSDKLLMFQIFNIQHGIPHESSIQLFAYYNYTIKIKKIRLEKCELGKNIDIKHKESIENLEFCTGLNYSDFYCINKEDSNITLISDEIKDYNYLGIQVYALEGLNISSNSLVLKSVIENNLINHFNRSKPLKPNYNIGQSVNFEKNSLIYKTIDINYIEYETDNGIINNNNIIYKGMELYGQGDQKYSNVINYDEAMNKNGNVLLGELSIYINGKSLERYKRTYPKLTSLIADEISIIQFIIYIYQYLTSNLYSNKIAIEITKNILSQNYNEKMKINIKNKKDEDNKIEPIKNSENSKNINLYTYKGKKKKSQK